MGRSGNGERRIAGPSGKRNEFQDAGTWRLPQTVQTGDGGEEKQHRWEEKPTRPGTDGAQVLLMVERIDREGVGKGQAANQQKETDQKRPGDVNEGSITG